MNCIKLLYKIICSFFCVVIFKIICVFVGIIEVIGSNLDCNNEVKRFNQIRVEGHDYQARDGGFG